ncbi:hypothetical protein ANN_22734 [Periplaneta americana]|uniref:Uncharacterized protein n=1 Tax=Periplaneta americana TaxID=6978 RepID=A0ABQ8SJ79_PERAM|nr:hypothetical protein ANN_22734 [Periplaneta americana]
MKGGDNAGEMSPGSSTESYPAFARIGLRENPGKNLNQVTCPDRDSNPGHLVSPPDALTVTPQMWTLWVNILENLYGKIPASSSSRFCRQILIVIWNIYRQVWPGHTCLAIQEFEDYKLDISTVLLVHPESGMTSLQNYVKLCMEESNKCRCMEKYEESQHPLIINKYTENKIPEKIAKLKNRRKEALRESTVTEPTNKFNFGRRLRWAGHVARMGESRNAYRVLVGRPEEKRPLGKRRRWEDNIKMDLREVGYDDRDWINLAQDRDQWRAYVRAAMNLRVP